MILKKGKNSSYDSKSSECKIARAARYWINSVPQTTGTTFAFFSVLSFFYSLQYTCTQYRVECILSLSILKDWYSEECELIGPTIHHKGINLLETGLSISNSICILHSHSVINIIFVFQSSVYFCFKSKIKNFLLSIYIVRWYSNINVL